MEATNWAPEHSDALREYLAKGMSYSETADAINAKFRTAYTRNAAIGRAKRMGLAGPEQPDDRTPRAAQGAHAAAAQSRARVRAAEPVQPKPVSVPPSLSSSAASTSSRAMLSLMELERGDCRYPYGGDKDGEAITFCGHPRRAGSSYCTPHFHLTRGIGHRLGTRRQRRSGPDREAA